MIAFLDTEFTDLAFDPRLLSIGIVVDGGMDREFYAEVTDTARLAAACRFAVQAVLPQFGRVAGAACPYAELCDRLAVYVADLERSLPAAQAIELAFDSDIDWALFTRAIKHVGVGRWEAMASRLRPFNMYNIKGFAVGELAARAYFKSCRSAPFARHHALCDARALRIAHAAATAANADLGAMSVAPAAHASTPSRPAWPRDPRAAFAGAQTDGAALATTDPFTTRT